MISLYNNQANKRIKFRISIEGVSESAVNPRLVIESPDKSGGLMVNGTIENNVCFFTIPTLVGFERDAIGIIYYEAIVEEDQYAKLWADQYKVVSKTEIKVVTDFEDVEEAPVRPKIAIVQNFEPEFEEIEDTPIEEKEVAKEIKKGINENKSEIIKDAEKVIEKIDEKVDEVEINTNEQTQKVEDSSIVDFYSFIKRNNKN